MKALPLVAVAVALAGLARWGASPAGACSYGNTPPPASVADAVLRSGTIVIGDLFAPLKPLDSIDVIRVDRAVIGVAGSEPVSVLLESPCGDRLPHIEPGRYVAFLRASTTLEDDTAYMKHSAVFLPIENGLVTSRSLSGVALELNGMTEDAAAAYVGEVAASISDGELIPPIGEPAKVFRTPAVATPRQVNKNQDLRGLLRGNGAILLGEVDQSRPTRSSDYRHRPSLVTRHRIRALGWLKRPARTDPGPWIFVEQPGARFGDVLFETQGDPLMQPGERYLFILQDLQTPDGGDHTGRLVPGLRLRIDDQGRVQPVDPIWLRYGGLRELTGLPLLVAVMRIRGAALPTS